MRKFNIYALLCIILLCGACRKDSHTESTTQDPIVQEANKRTTAVPGINHVGGLLHTDADFERMKAKVNASAQPWKGSYDLLVASPFASSTWTARPTAIIIRGGTGDNNQQLSRDVHAAYQNALLWKITGNTANGNKARDILNAWSSTLTSISGNADRFLCAGINGYEIANAGEMMRSYSGFNVNNFRTMLLNVFYPLNNSFLTNHNDACITNYWANWDLCNMASVLAIGIFCDDQAKIDQAINYFKTGAGNGSILHAVPFTYSGNLGQWQESGRDQAHSLLGIGLMGSFCEMAWNQGIDMYGYSSHRFMLGAEYVAKYNNGDDVPFTTYNWGTGQNCAAQSQTVISNASRDESRPIYEMVYNHYANRIGLSVPNSATRAARFRPEGGPNQAYPSTLDQLGFGSLTYYRDATSRPIANGTFSIQNRASGKMLDNAGSTADGAVMKQYPDNTSNNQKWVVTYSNGYYKISCVTGGKCLDSNNNITDGSNVCQWTSGGSSNQQWQIIALGNGYYKIFNRANGKCLDNNGATTDGANMIFWGTSSSNNQQWSFVTP
jgi:hypothetical protein